MADKPKPKRTNWPPDRIARNSVAGVGFLSLLVGIAAFDWRAACIVGGLLMLAAAITGMILTARRGTK